MERYIKSSDKIKARTFSPFLADTWWYGMTKRLSDTDFELLVVKREEQGFNAAQIVVGIPPEAGVRNENAKSLKGVAWNLEGTINYQYLEFVRERVKFMNAHNIMAIIYGAWGHQIEWIDKEQMCKWWKAVVDYLDGLKVIYCLTGESDLWAEPFMAKRLLPNKTTKDIISKKAYLQKIERYLYYKFIKDHKNSNWQEIRKEKWSYVLEYLASITAKPIIIHTTPSIDGIGAVNCPDLLAANTFQTGHNINAESNIWMWSIKSKESDINKPVINLEPWYEGIFDDFYKEKQIKAFWLSLASGASALCYGAHGIWNVGDSLFLSQWGRQTFAQALELETPTILGKSFELLKKEGVFSWNQINSLKKNDELLALIRSSSDGKKLIYIPDVKRYSDIPEGRYLNVNDVEFCSQKPCSGQLVVFC